MFPTSLPNSFSRPVITDRGLARTDRPFDYLAGLAPEIALTRALVCGDFDAVKHIVRYNKIDLATFRYAGHTLIHEAIAAGHAYEVYEWLAASRNPSELGRIVNIEGYTPLMLALKHGNIEAAKYLITHGANFFAECNDDNCDATELEEKREILAHTKLLLECGGSFTTALSQALSRGMHTFENIFSRVHNDLRNACANGNIRAARAAVAAGADASFVLMRAIKGPHHDISPDHARFIKALMAAGANASVALEYALSENSPNAKLHRLLLLGASRSSLTNFIATRADDAQKSRLASTLVNNWSHALVRAAKNDDKTEVKFWLGSGAVDPTDALMSLARAGEVPAIRTLQQAGVDAQQALRQFLDRGDRQSVQALISAGVSGERIVDEMAASLKRGSTMDLAQIQILIEAGANLSGRLVSALLEDDHAQIMLLIAAGVDTEAALKHLGGTSERSRAKEAFDLAAQRVAEIDAMIRRSGPFDITVKQDAIAAKGHTLRAQRGQFVETLRSKAEEYRAKGRKVEADLMQALYDVDWTAINTSVAQNPSHASHLLQILLRIGEKLWSRLLSHAGTDIAATAEKLLRNNATHVHFANFMQAAGVNAFRVLEHLMDSGRSDLAHQTVAHAAVDLPKMFDHLSAIGEPSTITKLTPLLKPTPRATATGLHGFQLFHAMITAGIDRARILVGAIEATDYDVVKAVVGNSSRTTPRVQLVATAARAIALAEGRASIAEMLLLLGAESAEERIATAQTLVMMGAGPVDASRELPVERMDELV